MKTGRTFFDRGRWVSRLSSREIELLKRATVNHRILVNARKANEDISRKPKAARAEAAKIKALWNMYIS